MKKLLILALLTIGATSYGMENVNKYVKLGVEFSGSYDYSSEFSEDDSTSLDAGAGFSIATEATANVNEKLELGLGIAAEIHGNTDDNGGYNSFPIYGLAKYNFNTTANGITPFAKVYLGYSINSSEIEEPNFPVGTYTAELKNGIYGGIGFGAEFSNNITVELALTVNGAELEESYKWETVGIDIQETTNIDHTKATLSIGYKF